MHYRAFKILILFLGLALLYAPTQATAVTLFEESYTGVQLDDLVTSGAAFYPSGRVNSFSGTDLIFESSGAGVRDILYRLPVFHADEMNGFKDLVITVEVDWDLLTADNDFGFGITDGSQMIGGQIGDQDHWWALDGMDLGTHYTADLSPNSAFINSRPIAMTIAVEESSSFFTIRNNSNQALSYTLAGIDPLQGIDVFLTGDDFPEEYGIKVLSVTANANPIPEPTTMLLLGTGLLGLAGIRRKFNKK